MSNSDWRSAFGSRVRLRLRELGRTQAWLAGQLHRDQVSLCHILQGRSGPTADLLIETAEALDVSLDWLTGRSDNEQ